MIYSIIVSIVFVLIWGGIIVRHYINTTRQIEQLRNMQNRLQEDIEHKIIMNKIKNKEIKPKHLIEIRECFIDKIDKIL